MMKILFTCSGIWANVKSFVTMLKPMKVMMNVQNARKVAMKVKSGYVALYAINGTSNWSNLSHSFLLLDYIKVACVVNIKLFFYELILL